VLPLENENINECWISDKDRFSYEALDSAERLTQPMLKQGGEWKEVDWQTALEYVAHGLKNIRHEHGADAIAAYATAHSTLEELALLKKLASGIGSDNIDFRLRQTDFALDGQVTPWLGMPIADVSNLQRALVIGSFLRKDHPLLASRLRAAVKNGGQLTLVHATRDDSLITVANNIVAAPSDWLAALSGIVSAVASAKGEAAPAGFPAEFSDAAKAAAASLLSGEQKAVFLGNAAVHHPQASAIAAAAQWIATATGATFGYLTEAANTVGGYIAGAYSSKAEAAFATPKKAYVLLNAEPELDAANPAKAVAALKGAEMVVVLSAFKHGADYADVLLPVAPFAETSGTFVNCEGRAQSFNGTVKPLGEARPAWKVLRVLGNILGLPGFDYDTSESVRDEVLGAGVADVSSKLSNVSKVAPTAAAFGAGDKLERIADVPIYFADALARRSPPLQATVDAQAPKAVISAALAEQIGVKTGELVQVLQGAGSAILEARVDAGLPANVVRVSAAHASTATLGDMFGPISVAKAGGAQ
jgi:NADH-quinone oxidoreductase subunit G